MLLSDEESKALQEMAKAAGKSIDAVGDLGRFIAKYIDGPLEQAFGIWNEKLKYRRLEVQIILAQRVRRCCRRAASMVPHALCLCRSPSPFSKRLR